MHHSQCTVQLAFLHLRVLSAVQGGGVRGPPPCTLEDLKRQVSFLLVVSDVQAALCRRALLRP